MIQKSDRDVMATGAKAFMMQIDLTSLLLTTRDPQKKLLLEKGFKRAEREWFDRNRTRR